MKQRKLFTIIVLVAVVVAAFLFVVFGGFLPSQGVHGVWQRDTSQFATGLAAQDDRVFTLDISGNIVCYSATSGQTLWNNGIGGYFCSGLTASADTVYGGKESAVGALDASTGSFRYSFGVPIDYSHTAPESITVVDGKVVATGRFGMGESITVNDATNGQLLWKALPYPAVPVFGNITNERDWWVSGYPLGGVPFEDTAIFAGGSDTSGPYIFKLDTANGNVIWRINGTLFGGSVLTLYNGQVIMQNGNIICSLNEASLSSNWVFDAEAQTYQPTAIYGDLLFFGAQNGNFYAVHLSNGSLVWKIPFDNANLLAAVTSDNKLKLFPLLVDSANQRVFWGYGVAEVLGTGDNAHTQFTGYLTALNVGTGVVQWSTKIEDSNANSGFVSGLAFTKDMVLLTENNVGNVLWVLNSATGSLILTQRFDHSLQPPVMSNGKVFVAADLRLTAY